MKGKYVETKFEKSSVIRQPNAFKSQRQSVLGKPATFSNSLAKTDFSKSKSVTTQNVSHDFSKPVTAQILPQNVLPIFKNINVIAPGMASVSISSKLRHHQLAFKDNNCEWASKIEIRQRSSVFFLSKDETPGVLIDFLTLVQRGLHAQVTTVQTDKGMKFLNKTLHAYFAKEGIRHETSTARTPEQNGVVERRNRTLVEAARTMLSAAKVPLFFWAKAIATACFTQNRSLVIPRHEKTPYHIINARKPSVKFFYIFVLQCYIRVHICENLDKIGKR
ncbi:retrovirus-related pol polyprotein from transposon TNT 1-94 [Tanacetum coccineum]